MKGEDNEQSISYDEDVEYMEDVTGQQGVGTQPHPHPLGNRSYRCCLHELVSVMF